MLLLVLVAILVICALTVFRSSVKRLKYFEERGVPYRKSYPIIGSMWPLASKQTSFAEFVLGLYNEFPNAKYTGAFDFGNPIYVIRDPELIKSLTIKNFDSFMNHRDMIDETIDPMFGANLVGLKGERWKEMRVIVSPLFTSSKMKGIFQSIYKCTEDYGDYLAKQPQPLMLNMKDVYTRYSNDIVATAIFGVSVNSMSNENNEFYQMGRRATDFSGWRGVKLFLFRWSPVMMKFFKQALTQSTVAKFFRDLVRDTIRAHEEQTVPRPDLIQLLMQARHKNTNEKLTEDEILAQTFIFFFAGFDSGSTLMCFATHQLAMSQDIQDKLRDEIDTLFEEGNGEITYEKVLDLKYIDMVLSETLRYYPSTTFVDRVAVEEFELPPPVDGSSKPVLVTPGMYVWLPIIGLHRDPKYFDEPNKFDPEHFSTENKERIKPSTYIPFGCGPRGCLGRRFALMQTKLILISLLRRFKIKTCEKTHVPMEFTKGTPTTSSLHGFWVSLEPRNLSTEQS